MLLDTGEGDCTVVRTGERRPRRDGRAGPPDRRHPRDAPVDRAGVPARARCSRRLGARARDAPTEDDPTARCSRRSRPKAVDVTGDERDELVARVPVRGHRADPRCRHRRHRSAAARRSVLAHDQLYKGSVVFRHGRLVAWAPVYKRTDGNCCPTWIQRDGPSVPRRRLQRRCGPAHAVRGVSTSRHRSWAEVGAAAAGTHPAVAHVVFLCTGNAARSVMAGAIARAPAGRPRGRHRRNARRRGHADELADPRRARRGGRARRRSSQPPAPRR